MKIGIDIIDISQIKRLKDIEKFMVRNFDPIEVQYIKSRHDTYSTLAGMFSAKEAVLKVLELGIFDMKLRDIVIDHKNSRAPFIKVTPALREKMESAGFTKVEISISHSDTSATAVCLME